MAQKDLHRSWMDFFPKYRGEKAWLFYLRIYHRTLLGLKNVDRR